MTSGHNSHPSESLYPSFNADRGDTPPPPFSEACPGTELTIDQHHRTNSFASVGDLEKQPVAPNNKKAGHSPGCKKGVLVAVILIVGIFVGGGLTYGLISHWRKNREPVVVHKPAPPPTPRPVVVPVPKRDSSGASDSSSNPYSEYLRKNEDNDHDYTSERRSTTRSSESSY